MLSNEIKKRIKNYNPYPKDIFSPTDKKKSIITQGRFNEFIHQVVENTKKDILKILEEEEC